MIYRQRKAFSLITAIFLILMMASVGALVMSLSGKIVQGTTAQYQKEQAVLLAKSYTELAIMAVMSNDRNGAGNDCIDNIDGIIGGAAGSGVSTNGEGYQVETRIAYIGETADIASCPSSRQLGNPATAGSTELNIIVDVYVRYKDINHPYPAASPWMSYHRRTLQKI